MTQNQKGAAAFEYLLVTIFATMLSLGLLTLTRKYIADNILPQLTEAGVDAQAILPHFLQR